MHTAKSHCENHHALLDLSLESVGKVHHFILHVDKVGKESKNHKSKLQALKAGGILH